VATAVGAYELEIITGPGTEKGERARLNLFSERGIRDRLGRIYFYGPQVTLENDFVDRGSNPVLHLHTEMLSSVLVLLDSEKPLFVAIRGGDPEKYLHITEQHRGRLTTTTEDDIIF
jgi:hypothetical protein